MQIGRVRGAIHSTINHPFYDGRKLLIVDYLDTGGEPTGEYVIAIDTVDSGAGETVLVLDEGNSARQIVDRSNAPVRSVIVGIVDQISIP
ncbi:MAG: EutN/CcmL family microcompartment protein [FCB group bacterium]|nr:EutN/CcmL family microcompartment protein [FCB group bacterium]